MHTFLKQFFSGLHLMLYLLRDIRYFLDPLREIAVLKQQFTCHKTPKSYTKLT